MNSAIWKIFTHCCTFLSKFKMAVTGALQTKAALLPLEWQRAWHLSLKLAAALLGSLGHQMVPHTLDFTGVYQERLTKVGV